MEDCSQSRAEAREKRPKSILKQAHANEKPEVKWDEMNILETYHPANKDYGHMKINEPPTPYSNLEDSDGESETKNDSIDPDMLTQSLQKASPRKHVLKESIDDDDEDDDTENLTAEAKAKKREFKDKRSHHYDEFSKVQLARQLIAKELEEIDKDDDDDMPEAQDMDTSPDT